MLGYVFGVTMLRCGDGNRDSSKFLLRTVVYGSETLLKLDCCSIMGPISGRSFQTFRFHARVEKQLVVVRC